MRGKSRHLFLAISLLATVLIFLTLARFSPKKATPTVDEILDKYVRAIGGRTAIDKVKTLVEKGSFESGNEFGKMTIYIKSPNKMLTVTDLPEGGLQRYGCDGTVAWAEDQSRRVVEVRGPLLQAALRECGKFEASRMRELFKKVDFRGTATANGRDAYVLEAVADDGLLTVDCFDVETGLLVQEQTQTPQGSDANYLSKLTILKYKEIEGVKVPSTVYQESPDSQTTVNWEEFQVNVPIDDSLFAKPTEIPERQ